MKNNTPSSRLTNRLIALLDKLFMRHTGSDKFRILANEKPARREKRNLFLKISQSHW
jgi:hypothetical protein